MGAALGSSAGTLRTARWPAVCQPLGPADTTLSGCVLLLPVAQILALKVTPHVSEPRRMRRWDNGLHRLYQLLVLALLIRTLDPLLSPLCPSNRHVLLAFGGYVALPT